MSTVLEPPEASPRTDAAGAGAGEREGPGIVQAELPDGMFPPLAEPFAGWMCLADCASDVAPGAGDVMRSAALLVRSAIEAQTPELGQAIATSTTTCSPASPAPSCTTAQPPPPARGKV